MQSVKLFQLLKGLNESLGNSHPEYQKAIENIRALIAISEGFDEAIKTDVQQHLGQLLDSLTLMLTNESSALASLSEIMAELRGE